MTSFICINSIHKVMKFIVLNSLLVYITFINSEVYHGSRVIDDYPFKDACTAIAVGRGATIDGSTMTTHTADCAECDWRINKVPARDWPNGSMRPIYLLTGSYPRQVREDRGVTWSTKNLENIPKYHTEWSNMKGDIIGYIPQVQHTYELIEGLYGIMNEHQVAIGESTCAARFFAAPVGVTDYGKALLEASELSQIALERCKTAREAIQLMGDLAVQYGFYSAEWDTTNVIYGKDLPLAVGGEALTVIDPTEAWMFHILPDDTGASAIWVAQRVPDDHITVVANSFVIKEVDPHSPDFLYSDNLWSIAEKHGWWTNDGTTLLNFKTTYAPQRIHPYYGHHRLWRVFTYFASPSTYLPPEPGPYALEYPFSIQVNPQKKISYEDLIRIQRDHYEGTQYSTTEGLSAGPFGDPNRYDVAATEDMNLYEASLGEFPRTISMFRTSYSIVAHARAHVPNLLSLVWLCQYAPDISTYIPLYVASEHMPYSFIRGTMHEYNTESAWWNFCVVGNYIARFYKHAISAVRNVQYDLEEYLNRNVVDIEGQIISLLDGSTSSISLARELLTQFILQKGDYVNTRWKDLFIYVLSHYRDGYILNTDKATIGITRIFYPKWWLDAVGYFNSQPNLGPVAILLGPNPKAENFANFNSNVKENKVYTDNTNDGYISMYYYYISMILTSVLTAVIVSLSMYTIHKYYNTHRYHSLPTSSY